MTERSLSPSYSYWRSVDKPGTFFVLQTKSLKADSWCYRIVEIFGNENRKLGLSLVRTLGITDVSKTEWKLKYTSI